MRSAAQRPASGHVVGAVVLAGQVRDVLALVAPFGHVVARPAGQQAGAERADLASGVVDVVLAADVVAGAGQHPGEGVAVAAPPAVADMDGAGGIGRDELDLHPLAVTDVGPGVAVLTLFEDGGHGLDQPPVVETEVDEAGSGQLDGHHVRGPVALEHLHDRGGQGARVGAGSLGRHQGDVGRPVAVLPTCGTFEVDVPGPRRRRGRPRRPRWPPRRPRRPPAGHGRDGTARSRRSRRSRRSTASGCRWSGAGWRSSDRQGPDRKGPDRRTGRARAWWTEDTCSSWGCRWARTPDVADPGPRTRIPGSHDRSRVASSVGRTAGRPGRPRHPPAPVAQRIERRPPEPKAQVRFLPGALWGACWDRR